MPGKRTDNAIDRLGEHAFVDFGILLGCLATLFVGSWSYGLYEPHEGHFAGVGREMWLSGDWITPHLNGSPYLNKPPLLYWMSALSQGLFGIGEGAARLPNILCAWLAVALSWLWARQLWGIAAGRIAAGMLTVSVGWFLFAHQLMIDIQLSSLILACLYCLWLCLQQPEKRENWLGFWLMMSFAFISKGPPGVLFPFMAFALLIVVRWRWDLIGQSGFWWGIPLMLAPAGAWAWLVEERNPGFLHHVLINEIWNRMFDERWPPDYHVSKVSALGYLGITAVWCAPWVMLLPQIVRYLWRESICGPAFRVEAGDDRVPIHSPTVQAHKDALLLLTLAALAPLIFLFVKSRLVYYCLPAVPPFALLAAGWWSQYASASKERPWRLLAGSSLLLFGLAAGSAIFWVTPLVSKIPELQAAPATLEEIPLMAGLIGGALCGGGLLLLLNQAQLSAGVLCAVMALACMRATFGFEKFQDVRSSKRMVKTISALLPEETVWVCEGSNELGASAGVAYYLGKNKTGTARTVRVMLDDPRREQPWFGPSIPRMYGLNRTQLQSLWNSAQPVVFVTDPLRKESKEAMTYKELPTWVPPTLQQFDDRLWLSTRIIAQQSWAVPLGEEPILPAPPGEALPEMFGFRRVYLNPAAWRHYRAKSGTP